MKKKTVGFIGYKGHVARLIGAFLKTGKAEISYFYHPEKDVDLSLINGSHSLNAKATRRLEDLYACDSVVVASPNHTHFLYLEKLIQEYKGYIFCEKPPVSTLQELQALETIHENIQERLYINFNMRFGDFSDILKNFPQHYGLGDPIRVSIIVGHGLGFKEQYRSSWRSQKNLHQAGVLETVGIHYFDLISSLFGRPLNAGYDGHHFSPYGDSMDTCHFSCHFDNNCHFNLTCSYCMPFTEEISIHYTNGILTIKDNKITVQGPRDVFDNKGFFISPPLKYEQAYDADEVYEGSIRNSCEYFMNCVVDQKKIDQKYFKQSMLSNRTCLFFNK